MTEAPVWAGSDELRPHLVPLRDLSLFPGNPRRGDTDAIAESLERFGQVRFTVKNNFNPKRGTKNKKLVEKSLY